MPLEIKYRQKTPKELTAQQLALKLQEDTDFDVAVHALSDPFYAKKHTTGVTPAEEIAYKAARSQLWDNHLQWSIANGLYEVISVEQQKIAVEEALAVVLAKVNEIRKELGEKEYQLIEKA